MLICPKFGSYTHQFRLVVRLVALVHINRTSFFYSVAAAAAAKIAASAAASTAAASCCGAKQAERRCKTRRDATKLLPHLISPQFYYFLL